MPGKYEPLARELRGASGELTFTFAELDSLVGGLPSSARTHRPWWANASGSTTSHARSWLDAGYVVDALDMDEETVRFVRRDGRGPDSPKAKNVIDGVVALIEVLKRAGYPTAMHAVAQHAVFLHADTVTQARGQALFPVIRDFHRRGQFTRLQDGARILLDDNTSPTLAFLWSARQKKGPDVQFNHVFGDSGNRDTYTALWNLCVTPAFLAKTTDGKNHPTVVAALKRRAFELFGSLPKNEEEPVPPDGYDELEWAAPPPPAVNLEAELRTRMNAAPKSRPAIAAREIGWLFSDWAPDSNLRRGR